MESRVLQYQPFYSFVDPNFWYKLTQIKLDIDKLEEKRKPLFGSFSFQANFASLFEVNSSAFNSTPDRAKFSVLSFGALLNKNTIDDFKECDKVELLKDEGNLLWKDIQDGSCIEKPNLLSRFFILSFAELKKYQFFYWFAFPSPSHPLVYLSEQQICFRDKFNENQMQSLIKTFDLLEVEQKPYFFIDIKENNVTSLPLSVAINKGCQKDFTNNVDLDNICFGFVDCSNNEYPGWTLRNLIALLAFHCQSVRGRNVPFVSLRIKQNGTFDDCLVFTVFFPHDLDGNWGKDWVGWERNERGKFGPRFVNMASSMDPIKLAESSVDLNLKLMKWRLLPDLNLDVIKETKCLLLGSGTLGCCVARNLLAWGVRHITFVDNGKVSYSNPVRQNLFTHEDCLNGGKSKATAAADNLKKVYVGVNSTGIAMHIPMPGHPVGESLKEQTLKDINRLTDLISTHDVIFLLLDSREARWLPTLLAAHYGKLVINAALGFDSYLVMRHGISTEKSEDSEIKMSIDEDSHPECSGAGRSQDIKSRSIPGHMLGCYFCNDVTAPGNSQKDRTLDQQCTVTRPGVANIAGALAAEMTIAITQHKHKINAPAPYNLNNSSKSDDHADDQDGVLGPIPHSIRGFLSTYTQVLPSSGKFKQCIACSSAVLNLYRTKNVEFLLQVFSSAKHLEDVTGLTELHIEADNAEVWALSDTDDE